MSESSPRQPPEDAGDDTPAPNETTYSDPSGAIFSMYITRALKFDRENVESWKGGADGILVFTGLFSSTVASLIAISYPTLQQDPNAITQSLLAQISQQLSNANSNASIPVASPSTQSPFSPSTLAVFINSVWFLSLVLSLTCALMATLLQQWARRYLQIIQRNHAPHVRAHIREYFFQGAHKFSIIGLVELLPSLLVISVFLFFAGLIAFAFLANHTVAYITLAFVGFCLLAYIVLTITPLISPDCPYYTSLTSILVFSAQKIVLSFSSFVYHGAKYFHKHLGGLVSESRVKLCHSTHENKVKSWSEDVISKLANSATKSLSMDIYKTALVWTLHQLDQDHELEDFVEGIPGLYESEAFSKIGTDDGGDVDPTLRNIRPVLAALPGPTSSDVPLPWSIVRLAQRAITNKLSKSTQQRRTQTCLRALYHIPGAIRDVLASYAAGKHYCLEILPLLNSPESLEIIDELWNTPNEDVALSVRCTAAVVAAFMITPPRLTLNTLVTPTVGFIGDNNSGKQFLAKRLRVDREADGGDAANIDPIDPNSDTARLQNIVHFLSDIKDTLQFMNTRWWASNDADSIRLERQKLFDKRHTEDYALGRGMFDQQGDRASPAFVPAVQQDLITLTLEILARDPVKDAATSQREAFDDVCTRLEQEAKTQARRQAQSQAHVVLEPREVFQALALTQFEAAGIIGIVKHALVPVFQGLSPKENATPPADNSSESLPQIRGPHTVPDAPVDMDSSNDTPGLAYVRSADRPQPQPSRLQAPPYMLQYSTSSSAGLATAVADMRGSPVWGSQITNAE
ncbi:hypothetical protein V8E53_011640 [Lactarius tabidus]